MATLCTFITIGRYLAESLTPWNLLVLHIIQLSAAGAMLAVDIVFHTYDIKHRFFILGIAFDCGLLYVPPPLIHAHMHHHASPRHR